MARGARRRWARRRRLGQQPPRGPRPPAPPGRRRRRDPATGWRSARRRTAHPRWAAASSAGLLLVGGLGALHFVSERATLTESAEGWRICSTGYISAARWCCRRHDLHCGDRGFADRTVRASAAGTRGRYLAVARRARPGADAGPDFLLVAGYNVYDALVGKVSPTYELGEVIAVSVLAYLLAEMFMGRGKSSTSSR